MVTLSSLTPCSAALAGADVAPKTLDTNVWVLSLGSKDCQGGRQVWAAAQAQHQELPSYPVHGRGWSGAAARAWHPSGHAATAQALGMPRSAPQLEGSGEGLRVSLKKRLPKYEARAGWGHFSRGQRRQLPFGRRLCQGCLPQPAEPPRGIAALCSTGVCGARRGEERRVSPKPPSQPLSSPWPSGEQTLAPSGICLEESQGILPLPLPSRAASPQGRANGHGRNEAWPLSASPVFLFQRHPGGPWPRSEAEPGEAARVVP